MDYIFDTPWWLLAALIITGLLFVWTGLRRIDKTMTRIGVVLGLVGLALLTTSMLVETDKEQIVRRTKEMIATVANKEWNKLEGYLDPACTASARQYGGDMPNRDSILATARRYTDKIGSMELNVQRLDLKSESTGFSTETAVYVQADSVMLLTIWQFHWSKEDKTWVVKAIELKQTGVGQSTPAP